MTGARKMPPWRVASSCNAFEANPSLSAADIATLSEWSAAGAPEGDPKDLPAPLTFSFAPVGQPQLPHSGRSFRLRGHRFDSVSSLRRAPDRRDAAHAPARQGDEDDGAQCATSGRRWTPDPIAPRPDGRPRHGLLLEAAQAIGVGGEGHRQDFDGNVSPKPRILRPVHLSHASRTERGQDLVRTEL